MTERMVNVKGLRELQDQLDLLGDSSDRFLELALVDAADLVAAAARKRAARDRVSGRAMNSIDVIYAPQGDKRVTGGGPTAPHYAWLDFGGSTKRWGGPKMRPMWRKFIPTGRYIYPAMNDLKADIEDIIAERMNEMVDEAGFTSGG